MTGMTAGRRIKTEIAIGLCFMILNGAALIWAIRVANGVFTPATLGAFLLARRLSSTGANFLQLGMTQTLMRHLPMNGDAIASKRRYVLTACALWASICLAVLLILHRVVDYAAGWVFPSFERASDLAVWAVLLALVTVLNLVVHATLLAERRVLFAKTMEFVSVSVLLLLPLLSLSENGDPAFVLKFQTMGMAAVSLVSLAVYLIADSVGAATPTVNWRTATLTFLAYGVPRGFITGLDMGLLAIGPWLLRTTPEHAGYLVIALTLVQSSQAVLNPVAQVASIVAARFVVAGDHQSLREEARLLLGGVVYVTVSGLAVFLPWSRWVLLLWLGDPIVVDGVLPYMFWLALGLVPVVIYQGLRGIIEIRWFGPRNLLSLVLATATHLGLYALLSDAVGAAASVRLSLLASLWTLGFLTLAWLGPAYLRPLRHWGLGRLVMGALAVLALNIWVAQDPHLVVAGLSTLVSLALIVFGLGIWTPSPIAKALRSVVWPKLEAKA